MPPALIGSALLNSRELVLAGLAMWLFAIVTQFFQTIKRLHDLGQSGWVSLSQLIPFVNIVVGLWLLFGAGTDGANKYGAKPV